MVQILFLCVSFPKSYLILKGFYVPLYLIGILSFSLQFFIEDIQMFSDINHES